MKVTKQLLTKIIKEEIHTILQEQGAYDKGEARLREISSELARLAAQLGFRGEEQTPSTTTSPMASVAYKAHRMLAMALESK